MACYKTDKMGQVHVVSINSLIMSQFTRMCILLFNSQYFASVQDSGKTCAINSFIYYSSIFIPSPFQFRKKFCFLKISFLKTFWEISFWKWYIQKNCRCLSNNNIREPLEHQTMKSPPPLKTNKTTRDPKGHISCTWVQCATFLMDWPGRPSCFSDRHKRHKLGRWRWDIASF